MLMKPENAMPEHCAICPRILTSLPMPCIGQFVHNGSYCKRAGDGDQEAIERIISWFPPVPEVVYSTEQPAYSKSIASNKATTIQPKVIESVTLLSRIKACPNWQPSSTCGCGVNLCTATRGAEKQVSHKDCFDCLREADAVIAAVRQPPATTGL